MALAKNPLRVKDAPDTFGRLALQMGQFFPPDGQYPLEDQVKTLADDELLDFWEEAQLLDRAPVPFLPSHAHYERVILQELMLRSYIRSTSPR